MSGAAHGVQGDGHGEDENGIRALLDLDPVGVADASQPFDTSATLSPSASSSYSWSTRLPWTFRSDPPSTETR